MVRHVLARQVNTAKLFNQPMRELVGGLMVSLDLSKAFDCLSYSEMYSSLLEVNVPESLAVAIMHLHHNTVLTIQHKGHSEQIGVQRGLRQGCGIAPIVYAAWTVKLRRQLDTALGQHWTAAHLSLFADDKHGFWAIEALRISIGHFISIQSTKMRINFTKSCALLGLKGRAQQKIMHTKVRQWNGVSCLMVPIFSGTISIPLSESMLYLGTKLSYGKFEVQAELTLLHNDSPEASKFYKRSAQDHRASSDVPVQEKPFIQQDQPALDAPRAMLARYSDKLKMYVNTCMLCGQHMVKSGHIKNHWRGSHPEAWRSAGAMASAEAKDLHLHSRQCPVLFQILAVWQLLQTGHQPDAVASFKPRAPKQSSGQDIKITAKTSSTTSVQGLSTAVMQSTSFAKDAECTLLTTSTASFVSLLRALEQAGLQPACLTFALALCGKAVEKDVPFLLAHSCRFRELTPGWAFDDRQRDSAEYLRTLWNQGSSLLRGGYPDIDPGTVYPGTLQQVIYGWY
eukprot:s1399_g16.t1